MGNSLAKSFDEFRYIRGIRPLIHEPSHAALFQQRPGSRLDLFQRTEETVKGGVVDERRAYRDSSERRWLSAWSPSTTVTTTLSLNLCIRGIRSLIFPLTSSHCYEGQRE